jgi:putative DNA primase/helicase
VTSDREYAEWIATRELKMAPTLVDEDEGSELPPLPEGRERRFYTIEQLGRPIEIDWLVEGWIAAGELSVIYGPGDSYKSFLALHWALESAGDREVVYIAGEGAHGMRTRIPAWLRHHEVDPDDCAGFRVDELPVILNSDAELNAWLAEVEDELDGMPDWVIVDTLSMCFNGDETSPQDMNAFVRSLERLRRSRSERTAVTVIHHTPVKDTQRERGTGALRNATFSMVRLSAKSPNGYSVLVECDRMKDAEKHGPERMKLVQVEWDSVSSLAVDSFRDASDEVAARGKPKEEKK